MTTNKQLLDPVYVQDLITTTEAAIQHEKRLIKKLRLRLKQLQEGKKPNELTPM